MVWQDAVSPTGGPTFDADSERERRLAAQARAGAEWALTALIARYQPTVVRYLTRLCGNPAQARRLAERIFQRMERRLHGPHGAENLRLWLLRACTEAGLETLRHPKSAPTPRLKSSEVAGLLTEESGKEAPGFLQSGIRRLRRAGGAVSRQARPLVWSDADASASSSTDATADASADSAPDAAKDSYLDEALDRLDPRDALRHRLVRVTLAELPYGDAQCLALHLVAGLNQAEVAKALGITNSAARKRIVHGLALFSDRYSQAVESLGLPVELGFGDAMPRSPIEPEPATEPESEPIVVSSQAAAAERSAPGEDRLIEMNPVSDRSRDPLSGVSYISEDSVEMETVLPDSQARPHSDYADSYDAVDADDSSDVAELTGAAGAASAAALDTDVEHGQHPVTVTADDAEPASDDGLVAEPSAAPFSGGLITRVAADAIIGPVVDALPVSAATPALPEGYGLAGPRSVPLTYELNSNEAPEPQGITMNWLDSSGLMTPLTFESTAVSAGPLTPSTEGEPLAFEAVALPEEALPPDEPATAENDALGYELSQTSSEEAPEEASLELPLEQTPDEASLEQASEESALEEPVEVASEELPLEQAPDEAPLEEAVDEAPLEEPVEEPALEEAVDEAAVAEPVGVVVDESIELASDLAPEPITVPVLSPPTDQSTVLVAASSPDEPRFGARHTSGAITRSLEALWDELSDELSDEVNL